MLGKNGKGLLHKIKQDLVSTELEAWRKKGLFYIIVLISFFPFYILCTSAQPDWQESLWTLRHFVGMALSQAIAQISIALYILKAKVPMYVIGGFIIMIMFFQVTFCILVILLNQT